MRELKNLKEDLREAEQWIRRLRQWSEKIESHPAILGMSSVLKYISSNGAQSARQRLEELLDEDYSDDEKLQFEGESQQHPEKFEITIEGGEIKVTIRTKNGHSVFVTGNTNRITIELGEDESDVFYPKLREEVGGQFDKNWSKDEPFTVDTRRAVKMLFASELNRARSTLRWAAEDQEMLLT